MLRRLLMPLAILVMTSPGTAAPAEDALWERVATRARALAEQPYQAPATGDLPDRLRDLDAEGYKGIRFDPRQALWRGETLFEIEFFHRGFLYTDPVTINVVNGNDSRQVEYRPSLFEFADTLGLTEPPAPGLGFAGFRIHYPLDDAAGRTPIATFLGASYFQLAGRGQTFGLSARGLAIDTGLPSGEEFPRFREFWLIKPKPKATELTFYALLDSQSLTGAYRFTLRPGKRTRMAVTARLFARQDIGKLGVAPLTSMFMWGENTARRPDDARPEVHNSDGLLLHTSADEWIWRPLQNPSALRITSLVDRSPKGFGLLQRDRRFARYQDTGARFQDRPSFWVRPRGQGWGKGAVQIIEIPSDSEHNDNIAAFWVPDAPFEAGQQRTLRYVLESFGDGRPPEDLARTQRTRAGAGTASGDGTTGPARHFVVDFAGPAVTGLGNDQPVRAQISVQNGQVHDQAVQRLPGDRGWRASFTATPRQAAQAVDLRLHLTLRGRRLSETWNYVWSPDNEG